MKPAADLRIFGRVVEALLSEALRCSMATEDALTRKAWHRVADGLADVIQAADGRDACPVCGEVAELVECTWCSATACDKSECLASLHAEATDRDEDGERPCPFRPEPASTPYDGPEEPDITFGEKKP